MSDMHSTPFHRTPTAIASVVVLLHIGGLAALQSGLLVRAYELVVPVEMISQIIEPPKPETAPPPPAPSLPPPPAPAVHKQITLPPAPQPLAINDPTPVPNAPVVAAIPAAPLPPITAPVAASNAPPAPPAAPPATAPKIELPRSDADYLNNPPPPYPPISRRMGEQGRVIVRVFVSEEGVPLRAEVRISSGFDRLDATAVATAMRYRYRPGMRGGVPEAMAVSVPFDFKLD
ncbi:MAG: energy transducer TonB [Brachymonas sp.]